MFYKKITLQVANGNSFKYTKEVSLADDKTDKQFTNEKNIQEESTLVS